MKLPSIITVRVGSSRLPGKCLLQFGNETVLHHVIRRAFAGKLDPILCTTMNQEDDIIEKIGKELGAKVFRGSINNKLLRWKNCCEHFNLKKFHTVDADDPFFCVNGIKKSFNLLNEGFDVVSPTISSSNGTAAVGFSLKFEIVNRAVKVTKTDEDTEMILGIIDTLDNTRITTLPEYEEMGSEVRLTLDYWEDYIMLSTIRSLLGEECNRKDIADLLKRNPVIKKINWARNIDWSNKQSAKLYKLKSGDK